MARPSIKDDAKVLLASLRKAGGSAGNGYLRDLLAWRQARYWSAREALLEEGKVVKGRGRGGSVHVA